MEQSSFKNKLIRRFSESDFATLAPRLERMELKSRDRPIESNRPIAHIYFPESGQLSVLAKAAGSEPIEVGIIGREGMSDLVPDLRSPFETIVQVAGEAHRIDAKLFVSASLESPALGELVMRYHRAMMVQLSYTALSHGSFTVEERLVRWLLMIHDRLDGDEIPLVHEFFAWMLAVRRAGVTEAMRRLVASGAIESRRGLITILNRDALIDLASESYGPAEAEYNRLFA